MQATQQLLDAEQVAMRDPHNVKASITRGSYGTEEGAVIVALLSVLATIHSLRTSEM